MIQNALEWDAQRTVFKDKMQALPYNGDLRRMLKNIDEMVSNLSRKEVDLRQRNKVPVQELAKVNDAIGTLEQWLIMATLLS